MCVIHFNAVYTGHHSGQSALGLKHEHFVNIIPVIILTVIKSVFIGILFV